MPRPEVADLSPEITVKEDIAAPYILVHVRGAVVAVDIVEPPSNIHHNLHPLCPTQELLIDIIPENPITQRPVGCILIHKIPLPFIETDTQNTDEVEMVDFPKGTYFLGHIPFHLLNGSQIPIHLSPVNRALY